MIRKEKVENSVVFILMRGVICVVQSLLNFFTPIMSREKSGDLLLHDQTLFNYVIHRL